MLGTGVVIAVCTLYMGLLLAVALWVERRTARGRRLARSGVVYALSLAVYCTSWTFYGSVGYAVRNGFSFLAVYLGPTLTFLLGWVVLRRLVRLKSIYRITSIADFVSTRYERSAGLGALVTVAAIIGSMPYIALQLRSLSLSFAVVATPDHSPAWLSANFGPLVVLLLIAFTIVVGVRRSAPAERHEGMVAAIALESVVKLAAFLAVGLFVTYGLFDGFGDIFDRVAERGLAVHLSLGGEAGGEYVRWTTLLVLSMAAVLLLPRQFHVAVVENFSPSQIRTAMWLFPLYMLAINLFVMPIAMGGLLSGLPETQADTFVLRLLQDRGHPLLLLLVLVGGFSAATSMIMVSAMTLSTMVSNHLVVPLAQDVRVFAGLKRHVLQCRWITVAVLIGGGHLFERSFGDSFLLVNIGLISFAASAQFAPVVLAGIFWPGANRTGAFWGLALGFAVWAWTLLVPALVGSGWLAPSLLTDGPWGFAFLRPERFLGMHVLDPLSQSVFWSLFFNVVGLVGGSLLSKTTAEGERLARAFHAVAPLPDPGRAEADLHVSLPWKRQLAEDLCGQYFSPLAARQLWRRCCERAGLVGREVVPLTEYAHLVREIETSLAGSLGAAAARKAVVDSGVLTAEETSALSTILGRVLSDLSLDAGDLSRRVAYHRKREALLHQHATELEQRVAQLDQEIGDRQRAEAERERLRDQFYQSQKMEAVGKLAGGVAHDFNNLLTAVMGYIELAREDLPAAGCDGPRRSLARAQDAAARATDLVRELLLFSRKQPIEPHPLDLNRLVESVRKMLGRIIGENVAIETRLTGDLPPVLADSTNLEQVLVNLVVNARDAMPDGGRVTIVTERCTVSDATLPGYPRALTGDFVCLAVSDTGVGIEPSVVPQLFEPFYTTKELGSGLGLAVVYGIVERHGGWIAVDSVPGQGSRFRLYLPIATAAAATARQESVPAGAPAAPAAGPEPGAPTDATGRHVLLVEDEPMVRELSQRALRRAGYTVTAVVSAEEALQVFGTGEPPFQALVSDVVLPGMTGIDLADRLRRHHPDLPIVLSSGYSDDTSPFPRIREHGFRFLPKPYAMDRLVRTLAEVMSRGALRSPPRRDGSGAP